MWNGIEWDEMWNSESSMWNGVLSDGTELPFQEVGADIWQRKEKWFAQGPEAIKWSHSWYMVPELMNPGLVNTLWWLLE